MGHIAVSIDINFFWPIQSLLWYCVAISIAIIVFCSQFNRYENVSIYIGLFAAKLSILYTTDFNLVNDKMKQFHQESDTHYFNTMQIDQSFQIKVLGKTCLDFALFKIVVHHALLEKLLS